MDKYQRYIIDKTKNAWGWAYYENNDAKDEKEILINRITPDWENDTVTIEQYENPEVIDYYLIIAYEEKHISDIKIFIDGKWTNVKKQENKVTGKYLAYKININFENQIEKLKMSFADNLADDYVLNVKYKEADKEQYAAKLAAIRCEQLVEKANIRSRSGADLVNIYFQPCCEEYAKSEIDFYNSGIKLTTYKIEEGVLFKSIDGLAPGSYDFVVRQYDKNNQVLFESEKYSFNIKNYVEDRYHISYK